MLTHTVIVTIHKQQPVPCKEPFHWFIVAFIRCLLRRLGLKVQSEMQGHLSTQRPSSPEWAAQLGDALNSGLNLNTLDPVLFVVRYNKQDSRTDSIGKRAATNVWPMRHGVHHAESMYQARSQTKCPGGALCAPLGVHIMYPTPMYVYSETSNSCHIK